MKISNFSFFSLYALFCSVFCLLLFSCQNNLSDQVSIPETVEGSIAERHDDRSCNCVYVILDYQEPVADKAFSFTSDLECNSSCKMVQAWYEFDDECQDNSHDPCIADLTSPDPTGDVHPFSCKIDKGEKIKLTLLPQSGGLPDCFFSPVDDQNMSATFLIACNGRTTVSNSCPGGFYSTQSDPVTLTGTSSQEFMMSDEDCGCEPIIL